jgi:hypothetical protein
MDLKNIYRKKNEGISFQVYYLIINKIKKLIAKQIIKKQKIEFLLISNYNTIAFHIYRFIGTCFCLTSNTIYACFFN